MTQDQKEDTDTRWIIVVSIVFVIIAVSVIITMGWVAGARFTTEWCRFEETC
ncbi:hypothetical protein [Leifsonia sp. Leaf264]|uniref:hypothetical protein n=1 Tax=Leifsonia sp. Leaf264 TaxID=1736314 RepID=UPI000A6CBF2F|nr:hypothetical protein [Leifsonia sp. Leaf264]